MTPDARPLRLWDLPTRLFHWLLVALVVLSYISGSEGFMELHQWSGLAILTLVVFRLIWGLIGSTSARFANFLTGPRALLRYLGALRSGQPETVAGHTPPGGWMIVALLGLLLAIASAGLFADDAVFFKGPLTYLVEKDVSKALTEIHNLLFDGLVILIAVHVLTVLLYRFVLKEDLITPMISGWRPWPSGPRPALAFVHPLWALLIVAAVAAAAYWLILV